MLKEIGLYGEIDKVAHAMWETGAEVMRWWMGADHRPQEDDRQITLFVLRLDEADV
mgnify:FL=1